MSNCQRCGHSGEQHSEELGFCGVLGCNCVAMVEEDDMDEDEDEDGTDIAKLNFDPDE